MSEEATNVSLGNINVPIMNVLIIGVWIVGTTISIVWQYYNVQSSLTSIGTEVKIINEKLGDRISNIEKEIDLRQATGWTRRDHEYWCSKTEQQNPAWKCGSFPEVAPYVPSSRDYWKSGKLEKEARQH